MRGPGVILEFEMTPGGNMIAQERIYRPRPDNIAVLELAYAPGDIIRPGDVELLGIVAGKVTLQDHSDIAPTTKAQRLKQDKALKASSVEDKALDDDDDGEGGE
jgi:hypothetical protein